MKVLLIGLALLATLVAFLLLRNWWQHRYRTNGPVTEGRDPIDWTIGPIVGNENVSKGMPLHPSAETGALFAFDFPPAPGSVHYVTYRGGSLTGKSRIRMRYRIEADPGIKIVPLTDPSKLSQLSLYFQRYGDDWTGKGKFDGYRWYAYFATVEPIVVGEFEMIAPLSSRWNAVITGDSWTNAGPFADAVADADQIGVVFGGGSGLGHGAFATGRARFVMLEFAVE